MTDKIPEREVTPKEAYFNRRTFLRGGAVAAGMVATGFAYRKINGVDIVETKTAQLNGLVKPPNPEYMVPNETVTPFTSITNYNNFYEFTTNKDGVAKASEGFKTDGWMIDVGGMCNKPRMFNLDDIRKIAPPEERIYRFRCVEAWSMVIPWAGYSFSKFLEKVEPQGGAKYVAFETLLDPKRFPNQTSNVLEWPYREGYRIDEVMHPLCMLVTGLYGMELPAQDGAPVRMILPWKYGFKNIKSIVKVTLTDKPPPTTWAKFAPSEYGFYGNVNPEHDHPRWSQATEQRIGESGRRRTLPFNGYADQVASLYAGMDLHVNF
jgi:methionine sulfoxide reductase catalytic subunit